MAARPWITPEQVREYTTYESVKAREDAQLRLDIVWAEAYVCKYCHQRFENYETMPEDVILALLMVAEHHAAQAAAGAEGHGLYKSETLDDYSYTIQDTQSAIDNMLLGPLLDDYIVSGVRRGVDMDIHII